MSAKFSEQTTSETFLSAIGAELSANFQFDNELLQNFSAYLQKSFKLP